MENRAIVGSKIVNIYIVDNNVKIDARIATYDSKTRHSREKHHKRKTKRGLAHALYIL